MCYKATNSIYWGIKEKLKLRMYQLRFAPCCAWLTNTLTPTAAQNGSTDLIPQCTETYCFKKVLCHQECADGVSVVITVTAKCANTSYIFTPTINVHNKQRVWPDATYCSATEAFIFKSSTSSGPRVDKAPFLAASQNKLASALPHPSLTAILVTFRRYFWSTRGTTVQFLLAKWS